MSPGLAAALELKFREVWAAARDPRHKGAGDASAVAIRWAQWARGAVSRQIADEIEAEVARRLAAEPPEPSPATPHLAERSP